MNIIQSEVLAPAGSYDIFKAVINAGADAVYLGGNKFGARAYAGNLTEEELLNAIDYAHIHNRKVYLTVNTLLKNNELLRELYDYIEPFYKAGLDAVIVQDYGVMTFINDNFPGMDIHASTQMTITEPEYIDFLKKYNVTRIVPARELSIDDIKRLKAYAPDMEIECFVHGALCYCYSGQCLMSSFYGGRSGNRGKCAGTCRLDFMQNGRKYPMLSLKDLSTLDLIPEILNAGVYSMKIEGRMKSVEYAAGVTSMYRKYVDMYTDCGADRYKVDEKDIKNLLMLFDRGGITKGYYVQHNGKNMIANEIKSDKSQADKAAYEKKLRQLYAECDIKEKININVTLLKNQCAKMTLSFNGNTVTVSGDMVQQAMNRPLNIDDVTKQVVRLGSTPFMADDVEVNMDNDIFIPNKSLNELRRCAVETLLDKYLMNFRRTENGRREYTFNNKVHIHRISVRIMTYEQALGAIECIVDRIYIETDIMDYKEIQAIKQECANNGIECFLAMPRVMRSDYDDFVKKIILDFDGYLIRNMAQLVWLMKNNINGIFVADYTMYGFNNLSCQVLYDAGFDEIVYPVELNEKEMAHLIGPDEIIAYGKLPLMVTAGCIDKNNSSCHKNSPGFNSFKDRKNQSLTYLTSCKYCYNVIYNSIPLFLTDKAGGNISYMFLDENKEQVVEIIKNPQKLPQIFTRGHYTKGVE